MGFYGGVIGCEVRFFLGREHGVIYEGDVIGQEGEVFEGVHGMGVLCCGYWREDEHKILDTHAIMVRLVVAGLVREDHACHEGM